MILFLLLTAATVAVGVVLGVFAVEWTEFNKKKSSSSAQHIKPKFEEFLKLYAESADKWTLKKDSVYFYGGSFGSHKFKVRFSFIDYLKYRLFFMQCNHHAKKEASQKEKEEMERALNALQEEVRRNTR